MSTPCGQDGGGRAVEPPTPVASTSTPNRPDCSLIRQELTIARNDSVTAVDQVQRTFNRRRLTVSTPAARPLRPNLPQIDGGSPAPSALGKRGADTTSSALAPPAKKVTNPSTRSGLTVAEQGGGDADQRAPDTEPQTVDKGGAP